MLVTLNHRQDQRIIHEKTILKNSLKRHFSGWIKTCDIDSCKNGGLSGYESMRDDTTYIYVNMFVLLPCVRL